MVTISISLLDDLLSQIEKAQLARGLTRSEFFWRLAKDHLRREREQELEQQYMRGYREQPETAEKNCL